jgi:hypothetical protein
MQQAAVAVGLIIEKNGWQADGHGDAETVIRAVGDHHALVCISRYGTMHRCRSEENVESRNRGNRVVTAL